MAWRSTAGLATVGAGVLLALACRAEDVDTVYLKFLHNHGVPCQAILKRTYPAAESVQDSQFGCLNRSPPGSTSVPSPGHTGRLLLRATGDLDRRAGP